MQCVRNVQLFAVLKEPWLLDFVPPSLQVAARHRYAAVYAVPRDSASWGPDGAAHDDEASRPLLCRTASCQQQGRQGEEDPRNQQVATYQEEVYC